MCFYRIGQKIVQFRAPKKYSHQENQGCVNLLQFCLFCKIYAVYPITKSDTISLFSMICNIFCVCNINSFNFKAEKQNF